MRTSIAWGTQSLELEIDARNLVAAQRADIAPNLADPIQALRDALESPLDYPALRRALIPDDHVAIYVDEGISQLGKLLVPLLAHVRLANVQADAITLICAPPSSGQPWLDDLPDAFQDVHIEVHQPADRKKLAYLATTKQGRRVYLNRTAVDADQFVLLTRRRYDACVGYAGAETALYPGLSEEATIAELRGHFDRHVPGAELNRIQAEARTVAWHLGAPFFVQLIEGTGDGLAHVVAGPLESSDAGQRLLDARWRVSFAQATDVVIASITGDPARQTLDDLARAYFSAARIVKPSGSIVLLTEIAPALGPGFETFRRHDDSAVALRVLMHEKPSDLAAAFMWATAANQARLYLLSGLASDVAEEIFTIPMQHAAQAQRLLTEEATCALLPDAHKALAVLS
jgi:nickel-dependent lactate racemase